MVNRKKETNNAKHSKSNVQGEMKHGHKRWVLLLALISFLVYANTFSNDYAYDDYSVISKNTLVTQGVIAIPQLLSSPYRFGFFKTSNDLYRPLSLVTFATEYQLFQGRPAIGHFINVLLFACCVALLFMFLDDLFDQKRTMAVFVAALLFALHPIHTEVVANIKGRDELLCFFFGFLSLLNFLRYARAGKLKELIVAVTCFFLSLLSKETSICFLAIVPLIFFFYERGHKPRSVYITACTLAVALLFLFIRWRVLVAYDADHTLEVKFIDNFLVGAHSATERLATAIYILGKYVVLLFIPYPLACDYSFNTIRFHNFGDITVLLSLFFYLALLVFGVFRLLKFRKDVWAFAILFFLFSIALFANVFFAIGAAMAERFVFFASVGFCLLLGLAIEELLLKLYGKDVVIGLADRRRLLLIVPLACLLGALTIIRNADWKDNLTLYAVDAAHQQHNARLAFFLGNELLISRVAAEANPALKDNDLDTAIYYLRRSLEIYPQYDDAHRALGNAFYFKNSPDSAEFHYSRAIALNPADVEAMGNLDVIYFNQQKFRKSIALCRDIIKIDPAQSQRYNNMGICYIRLAQYDSAAIVLKQGIKYNDGFNPFYENLALAYKLYGSKDSAIKYQSIARKQNPVFSVY